MIDIPCIDYNLLEMRLIFLLVSLVLMSACTVEIGNDRYRSGTYIGIVRVSRSDVGGQLLSTDVKALGLGVDHGAFLGWRQSRLIYVKPGDCQVVLIFQHHLDAEHIEKLLHAMGDKPCIADFSHSLPPR